MRSQAYMGTAKSEGKTKKEHFTKCKTSPLQRKKSSKSHAQFKN